jgi:hypothetical protein
MKTHILFFVCVFVTSSSFSQTRINSNLFLVGGDSLLSIDVFMNDVFELKDQTSSTSLDDLIRLKHKKLTNRTFHYNFSISYSNVFYWQTSKKQSSKVFKSDICYVDEIVSLDNSAQIKFWDTGKQQMKMTLIESSDNVVGVILTVTKNGKTKTFFSKTCVIEKQVN